MISASRSITRFLLVLAIALISNSCVDTSKVDTSKAIIIAHRGYHLFKGENTYESFLAAYNKGLASIEFDIAFTKDNIPVIAHDNSLGPYSDSQGYIPDMNSWELPSVTLTGGYVIPTLDSVLKMYAGKFSLIFIDIKVPCSETALKNFDNLIKLYNAQSCVISTCLDYNVVDKLHAIDPSLKVGGDDDFESGVKKCIASKYYCLLVDFESLDDYLLYIAHANNIKVYAYTPNDYHEIIQTLHYDVDGIMTDNPDLLQKAMYEL